MNKEKFEKFEKVRKLWTNPIYDWKMFSVASGLSMNDVIEISQNYEELAKKYN